MKNVILYTQPGCPPCEFTKNFLDEHGIQYELKCIKRDSRAREELIKLGAYSTPTMVVDVQVITGFQHDLIVAALEINKDKE